MKRFVLTLGSVGWTNTLFSRHSILKPGLPAATVVTVSPTSITVRWFNAVCTWTIWLRSGFWISIFCAQAGKTNTITTARALINLLAWLLIWGFSSLAAFV